jgi:anti-sigma regulatory factor (Ser/Thr protein kinase)
MSTAHLVRRALRKGLAARPAAVVVDLRDVEVAMPTALTVFAAALRHRDTEPDVVMILCVGSRTLRGGAATTAVEGVAVVATLPEAVALARAAERWSWRRTLILPVSAESPQRARDCVTAACEEWDVGHIKSEARLVVSELVTNAVVHGGGDVRLEIVLRGAFLHIRVRDGNPAPPQLSAEESAEASHGRGLRLVDLYASGWGYTQQAGGKVVWATLRTRPIGG